jgi:NADPH:quinone reductase-like Zn-dependent oxidoreductase
MKAIVQERFGPPDVLQLVDTDPPEAGAGELTKPKARVAGIDAAGRGGGGRRGRARAAAR